MKIKAAQIDQARVMEFWRFVLFDLVLELRASLVGGPRTSWRNSHLVELGVGNTNGHPKSRHLPEFGHLMAADLSFDQTTDREIAILRIARRGYHPFVGGDYGAFRLHVQAVKPGADINVR